MYTIYLISNIHNDKKYVGQTNRGMGRRWIEHVSRVKNRTGRLYSAIKRYGRDSFSVSCLAETDSREKANILEAACILLLRSSEKQIGYNLTESGSVLEPTEETRRKIRLSKLGCKNPNFGKEQTANFNRSVSTSSVLQLRSMGFSCADIAKRLKTTYNLVYGRVQKHPKYA